MNKEYTNTRLKSNIVHLSDPKLICIHTMEMGDSHIRNLEYHAIPTSG